ncbi:extracellular lipase, Pla-1/cef family [Luteitalea pratensis]|uniref:Extracellular lipase, Pla-1/cef family n=1 Tax=Luteitalea pratensis TaxID=1855912 RepID=A0A143PJH5_LUTPR|nr:hypothetical protein [Luteitalea pratensis]AMY07924.1 extracellular lipase, Pla-1/cef family [Luteitalea pratensis]
MLDFTTRPSGHIAAIPTRTGRLTPTGSVGVAFNLWLPSGRSPDGGWPVAICGHGRDVAKNFCVSIAAMLASPGLAVISANAMGHGAGSRTTMTVTRTDGTEATFSAPGLGSDQNGDGMIATWEPSWAERPFGIYGESGPILQSAAHILQLVRAIQKGVDGDGDGGRI